MNKSDTKNEEYQFLQLQQELQQLRKGSGLQPWKLQHMMATRERVARQLNVDPATLSMSQMYTHLLGEISDLGEGEVANALRNAYAIGQNAQVKDVTGRRYSFALQVKRHPDTVKAYEDRAIGQLAHRLLSGHVKPVRLAPGYRGGTPPDYDSMSRALLRTVVEGLAGLYTLGIHSSEILRALGRSRYPYLNASIECRLSRSERGDDWYKYEFRYRFHCVKDVFRIGIVSSVQDSGILMASGLFDEATQLSAGANFDSEMEAILKLWSFTVHDNDTGKERAVEFTQLDTYTRRQLLEPVWQINADNCRVIEAHIPSSWVKDTTYYELHTTVDLSIKEHYAYWEAPGLMYVNTVTIDVSDFPDYKKWRFFLKPFLGTSFVGSIESKEGRFVLPVNSWVMHGHGIAIVWQET